MDERVSTFGAPVLHREDVKERIDKEVQVAESVGFNLPDTDLYYQRGTALAEIGVETLRKEQDKFDLLPYVAEAIPEWKDKIDSERRKVINLKANDFWVNDEGYLTTGNGGKLIFDKHTWNQFTSKALHSRCKHSTEMISNVNSWVDSCKRSFSFATRFPKVEKQTRALYRVNPIGDGRSYTAMEFSDILSILENIKLPPGCKMKVDYDKATTGFDISINLQNPCDAREGAVGMMHDAELLIRSDDSGRMKIKTSLGVRRVACLNLTRIPYRIAGAELKHVGESYKLRGAIQGVVNRSKTVLDSFSNLWDSAFRQRIHDKYDGSPMGASEVFRRLIVGGWVNIPGLTNSQIHDKLMTAWEYEPGDTVAHVQMAMTRLHEDEEIPWYAVADIEESAGELLYQRVSVLPPMTKKEEASFV